MRAALTIVLPSTSPAGQRVLRLGLYLGLLFTAIAILLLALAPFGWRVGWWGYRFSLLTLMPYAAYAGLAAAIVSALLLLFARRAIGARGGAMALAALVAGGLAAYVPWHYRTLARSVPPIDDITTDTANPPAFVAVVAARLAQGDNPATYGGARIAQQQRRAYPDIAPLALAIPPARAFSHALDTAQHMGWTIVDGDPVTGRIEANDRSLWFGFTDDIVIRISASGTGSRVDLRSSSRHGRGDFGVNAARIRAYLAALHQSVGGQS